MDSMLVTETTCDEIKNIIVSLKNSSSGWNDIHSKVLHSGISAHFQLTQGVSYKGYSATVSLMILVDKINLHWTMVILLWESFYI